MSDSAKYNIFNFPLPSDGKTVVGIGVAFRPVSKALHSGVFAKRSDVW